MSRHLPPALICLSLLAATAAPPAAADEIDAVSTVAAATIYPQGATVTRQAAFDSAPGRHEIVISDLPLAIDADSLRVTGEAGSGAFSITGLRHRVDAGPPRELPDSEREAILRQIRDKEWERTAQELEIARAAARRSHMADLREAIATPGGDEQRRPTLLDAPAQWAEAWGLLDGEMAAADTQEIDARRQIEVINREINRLRDRLDAQAPDAPRGVVTVSINVETAVSGGALEISYLTPRASWTPLYDLRLGLNNGEEAEEDPNLAALSLVRRAAIRQSTGEAWEDVAVALSTARPSGRVAAQEPPLQQAALVKPAPKGSNAGLLSQPQVGTLGRIDSAEVAEMEDSVAYSRNMMPMQEALAPDLARPAPPPVLEAGALAAYDGAMVIYELPTPVTAPGDGAVRQVRINEEAQSVSVMVRATPSQDPTAYLYAKFDNGEAPLLPGRASIYRDGAYMGAHHLEYVAPGDSSALPFGPYDSVTVDRVVKRQREGDEGVFSVSTKRRSRYELTAVNLSGAKRTVTLFDALPYTETDDIDIDLVATPRPTERDVDGRRGALAWTFELDPGERRAIAFGYDVAWPEGAELEMR